MKRTHKIGELNEKLNGKEVTLTGWVDTIRDHGKVTFIDLRDRYGIVQCVIPNSSKVYEKVKELSNESCVLFKGEVKERPKGSQNEELGTGNVEVKVSEIEIFSKAERLPFEVDNEEVNEDLNLKHRYLGLRKGTLKKNLILRHKIIHFIREYLDKEGFLEIQTPILTKSTPEGARDYIVPSRIHKGKFYALPQSPQQYKQLLMVAGVDKYFQIAPCFRDEDARVHRCPGEFYQLDLEMSFADQEDILDLTEDMMVKLVEKIIPDKKLTFEKFPRLTYKEVIDKYGTDKPDLRKNKKDKNELAFCWVVDFPLFTPQTEEDFFHGSGEAKFAPSHHMFTQPREEDLKFLNKKDAHKVKSYQHDLVLNGFEVGGGSIRIHNPEIQNKIFDLIGFSKEQKEQFEHMLTAFKYGVPPHGGIAPGIDRLIMALLGAKSIRDVIAFPKNREAKDVMLDAPSNVEKEQLDELNISVKKK